MVAPERIWMASTEGKCHVGFDTPSMNYTNEYIRADLMAELVEALRECHDALRDHAKMYPHMVKGFTHDAEKRAAATLAKLKDQTK